MTRVLYLPDECTVVQLEVKTSPAQLCAAINAGMRPLGALRNGPPGRLTAHEMAGTVIIAPVLKQVQIKPPARSSTGLSRRQIQVHELATRGLSSGEIALMLHLSRRTVNYHLNQVKNRLQKSENRPSEMTPIPLKFEADE